jgi:hypothetical protein
MRAVLIGMCTVSFFLIGPSAPADAAKKKKHAHGVRGVIERVQQANNKEGGSITVKVQHRKKNANNGSAVTVRTFRVGPGTAVFKNGQAVTLAALKAGERVLVHTMPGSRGQVARIDIGKRKKRA